MEIKMKLFFFSLFLGMVASGCATFRSTEGREKITLDTLAQVTSLVEANNPKGAFDLLTKNSTCTGEKAPANGRFCYEFTYKGEFKRIDDGGVEDWYGAKPELYLDFLSA